MGSVFSFEPQTVSCTLLCLAGNSPVTGPSSSSDAADSVVPSLRALVYRGGSIVNLLRDTLSCRCVQLDNRPPAVLSSVAVCSGL